MTTLPKLQTAVQLTGPDQLVLNTAKPVPQPNDWQILARVEAVGLCFSDLKLLKQFSAHGRKGPVAKGIEPAVLNEIPSYVPDEQPTVPGHETVVRIVAVGKNVKHTSVGDRCLVQTDYRWLPTQGSCSAFGYNFEGALQQYVLMDERVITAPDGRSMLIPADDRLSAAAIALVEPWACVEDAYAVKERRGFKPGGKMLIVADPGVAVEAKGFSALFKKYGQPASVTLFGPKSVQTDAPVTVAASIADMPDNVFDDILYFGADPAALETVFKKIANAGLLVIAQGGKTFGRPVETPIGRIHYGNIRIIGTSGHDPAEALDKIPAGGEIRKGDKINVIGAGGPMGVMHVVRNLCQGVPGVTVYGGDLDDNRLEALSKIARPLARKNQVGYTPYNPSKNPPAQAFDYIVLMAPVAKLVAQAVLDAAPAGLINIFAGIPATVFGPIDLDTYCRNNIYFIGTSGSTLDDMLAVLAKVQSGALDTNISVAAVCGLHGAIEGIRAVEHHTIPGKIIVYPDSPLPLTPLENLNQQNPDAAAKLADGLWTKQAEQTLIKA
jgi:threonine dehydrogenase-like Zn-dependent dehydrogenase